MSEELNYAKREHLPGLELARSVVEEGWPKDDLLEALDAYIKEARATHPAPDAVEVVVEVVAYMNAASGEVVKYGPTVMDWDDEQEPVESLITVAQHNRIMAAAVPAGSIVVPVEFPSLALELCDVLENKDDISLNKWALKSAYLVGKIRAMPEVKS